MTHGIEKLRESKTKAEVQNVKGDDPAIFCSRAAPSLLSLNTNTTKDADKNENPRIMFSATMKPVIILLKN